MGDKRRDTHHLGSYMKVFVERGHLMQSELSYDTNAMPLTCVLSVALSSRVDLKDNTLAASNSGCSPAFLLWYMISS